MWPPHGPRGPVRLQVSHGECVAGSESAMRRVILLLRKSVHQTLLEGATPPEEVLSARVRYPVISCWQSFAIVWKGTFPTPASLVTVGAREMNVG